VTEFSELANSDFENLLFLFLRNADSVVLVKRIGSIGCSAHHRGDVSGTVEKQISKSLLTFVPKTMKALSMLHLSPPYQKLKDTTQK
jgi:hypothetical protein